MIEINFISFFTYLHEAPRTFKIAYVAYIIFLLHSAHLDNMKSQTVIQSCYPCA